MLQGSSHMGVIRNFGVPRVCESMQAQSLKNEHKKKVRGKHFLLGQVSPFDDLCVQVKLRKMTCSPLTLPVLTGDYSPGDILGDKYHVKGVIGRGSNGVTYKV